MSQFDDQDIVFLEGARTPIGTFMGSLSSLTATQLGTIAAKAALERSGLSPEHVGATFMGNVIQADSDAVYLARHVGLHAGVPIEAPALTLNRLCASGMEAIVQGARTLKAGEAQVALVGGAETMSRVPHALRGTRKGWGLGQGKVEDVLWSALTDTWPKLQIGQTVEHLAQERSIPRADADAFAAWSHKRAAAARERGRFAREITPVEIKKRRKTILVEHDENIRPDADAQALAHLPGLYGKEGINTAGNSSGLHDAAAMLVIATGAFAKAHGLKPLGKLRSWGIAGIDPKMMGLGPVPATQQALSRAGLKLDDLGVIEINDSFAVQYLAVEAELGLNRERVNLNGGCLALGHPMGATGARLAHTVLLELQDQDTRFGLATLCVGGGMGMSLILERV